MFKVLALGVHERSIDVLQFIQAWFKSISDISSSSRPCHKLKAWSYIIHFFSQHRSTSSVNWLHHISFCVTLVCMLKPSLWEGKKRQVIDVLTNCPGLKCSSQIIIDYYTFRLCCGYEGWSVWYSLGSTYTFNLFTCTYEHGNNAIVNIFV